MSNGKDENQKGGNGQGDGDFFGDLFAMAASDETGDAEQLSKREEGEILESATEGAEKMEAEVKEETGSQENQSEASGKREESEEKLEKEEVGKEDGEEGVEIVEDRRFGGKGPLKDLIDDNYLQFATYTICNRAIPTLEDGLKPVQRRILHSLWEHDDGRFSKVAGVVGDTMHYHPHGDASIYEAIVNLVNMRYLIEGQGNYGNIFTGHQAAAARYIECRLTDLARQEIFNKKITSYTPSYDGRNMEPILLPSKLPILLMMGAQGIAAGLSTEIFPHNFVELIEAEIAIIQNKPFKVYPDFVTGGIIDVSEYADGQGKLRIRSTIEPRDKNKLVITSLPWGETTESLIESIEEAISKKKVQVREITDLTAEQVEIELILSVGAIQEKVIQELYAFTGCEKSLSSRPVLLHDNRPKEMTVSEILRANVELLLDILKRELEVRRGELDVAFHSKTLEQIFIEERIYKRIEEQQSYEAVQQAVLDGLAPFRAQLRRDVTLDDVEQLLQIKIRRISRYDIEKNRKEIEDILKEEAEVAENLTHLRGYATKHLREILRKYGKKYGRVSQISESPFGEIEVRALTATELTIKIDRVNGYIGTDIRGGEELFKCSSLDKIIVLWQDGRYKMMPPPQKFFIDQTMLYCEIHDKEKEFTSVYTEPKYGFTYIKRFKFGGCIQNKEYSLAPEKSKIIYFVEGTPEALYVKYKPAKGQRVNQQLFNPGEVLVKGVSAKGRQMTSKAIRVIVDEKPRGWDDDAVKGTLF